MNCIAAVPATAIEICYRSDQLVSVSTSLLYCPHLHLRTETMQLLANIFNTISSHSESGNFFEFVFIMFIVLN